MALHQHSIPVWRTDKHTDKYAATVHEALCLCITR